MGLAHRIAMLQATCALIAGTKCINGGSLSHTGRAINDLHAEILVRRALKKYLYNQLQLALTSLPSVFVSTGKGEPEPPC